MISNPAFPSYDDDPEPQPYRALRIVGAVAAWMGWAIIALSLTAVAFVGWAIHEARGGDAFLLALPTLAGIVVTLMLGVLLIAQRDVVRWMLKREQDTAEILDELRRRP